MSAAMFFKISCARTWTESGLGVPVGKVANVAVDGVVVVVVVVVLVLVVVVDVLVEVVGGVEVVVEVDSVLVELTGTHLRSMHCPATPSSSHTSPSAMGDARKQRQPLTSQLQMPTA